MEIGDNVIVRSNEDTPLMSGVITRWYDNDGKWSRKVPIVRSSQDDKEYTCFGFVMAFNDELFEILQTMTPKEQYNYIFDKFPRE